MCYIRAANSVNNTLSTAIIVHLTFSKINKLSKHKSEVSEALCLKSKKKLK